MNFWQVAAGEGGRDYSSLFTRFGVTLIGAGDPGSFRERPDYYERHRGWRAQVVAFAKRVKLGDVVVLKRPHRRHKGSHEGQWEIVAVGKVTGEYAYLESFEDVEGWDLQHCRKVEWIHPNSSTYVDGLARGTFRAVHSSAPKDVATQILNQGLPKSTEALPPLARKISDEELVERLVDSGLRPANAETVIQAIWRVRRLARWYRDHGRNISEHETRTFLIVPILLALGWSEQKMKIEWNNLDIAFFPDVYGRKTTPPCIMILESKRMWEGLSYAEGQVKRYQKEFPECSRLIVSDGICYRLYQKNGNDWPWVAYLNLLKLRERHPYYTEIKGASDVLVSLMPK